MDGSNQLHVLLAGDSRVKYLENILSRNSLNLKIRVECLPGARLERIMMRILSCIAHYDNYNLVIIAGGINDLTCLKFNPCRHATLRHLNAVRMCDAFMSRLRSIYSRIERITATPIVISTLPGMDLSEYAPGLWHQLILQQPILDQAIVEINRQIRGLNRSRGQTTLNLAYPVHRCAGRRGHYYAHYALLYDGLHPGAALRERWVQAILNFCALNLTGVFYDQETLEPCH